MVVINKRTQRLTLHIAITVIMMAGQMHDAMAEMMAKGKTKFKFLSNLYHQNSNDGAQVIDNHGREEDNVIEPMIFIEHQISEHTAINAHAVFDAWTAASDTKIDGLTGASGEGIKGQTRLSADLGVRQEYGSSEWHSNFGFSSEHDYRSLNGAVGASKGFAQDNFNLGVDLRYYADAVKLFDDLTPAASAKLSDYKPRQILGVSLSASQILTVKDIVQLSLDFVRATNNLESTASTVLVDGIREVESLPGTRARYASSLKWVHGLGEDSALHLDYRYYFDQWGVDAHTLGATYLLALQDDQDMFEVSTRFHHQSKVRYYGESFSSAQPGYRTSDSDLEDFNSYELGLAYVDGLGNRKPFNIKLDNVTMDYGANYAIRSNGLRYGYIQTSVAFSF